MPSKMDLVNGIAITVESNTSDYGSEPKEFALHALAAIRVHDSREDMTYPEIAKLDRVLSSKRDVCSLALLYGLGKNCAAAFYRVLTRVYRMAPEDIDKEVAAITVSYSK